MRRQTPGLLLLALGATLAGCGGSHTTSTTASTSATPAANSDQRGILATVDALQTASRKGDGRSICTDIFTAALVRSVEKTSKRRCPRGVRSLFSPREEISVSRGVRVIGDRATATIREQTGKVSTLFFVKQGARWRIDRVQPQARG